MLAARLVRMIEDHAEELTRGVLNSLETNSKTPTYHKLSRDELHRRVYEVYRNLGRWLTDTGETLIEASYSELGRRRQKEGVPLREVVYALILTKSHLRAYIRSSGLVGSAVDLYQEEELNTVVGHFFDKAMYYTVKGYENEGVTGTTTAYHSRQA